MNILSFPFDSRPTCHAHVQALRARMCEITWVLRHLEIGGFSEDELATVYKTVVWPILNYTCVVYHHVLTDELDQTEERLQCQSLKYSIATHRACRIKLCVLGLGGCSFM